MKTRNIKTRSLARRACYWWIACQTRV